jgi:hypothetical protein
VSWRGGVPLLLLLLVLTATACDRGGPEEEAPAAPEAPPLEPHLLSAELYFPGAGGRLYPEIRELAASDDPEQQVRSVVEALLAGPQGDGLVAPLPEGVEIALLHLDAGGVVYLDLRSPDDGPPPPDGSSAELQRVYSLVNSILLNVEAARRVVLLWNGVQPTTFAGHVDTTRPLTADRRLMARR